VWNNCVTGATYSALVDWNQDGVVTGVGENVTPNILDGGRFTYGYGRDQARQLSPSAVGQAGFVLCNANRMYSPENQSSPLFGDLGPAREVTAEAIFQNVTYPLFTGRIDDFSVHADRADRTVDFTILDGMALLQDVTLSTAVYEGRRTGEIVNLILDEVGWSTTLRDFHYGASFTRFWLAEDTDAFSALQEVVRGEGPPAIAYVAPDGKFVFRDRHHRLQRIPSLISQALFASTRLNVCPPVTGAPMVTGSYFSYTPPFEYQHGWRDIVNVVQQSVDERRREPFFGSVWSTDDPFSILIGQTLEIKVSVGDPFKDAITPVLGIDFQTVGVGVVTATLSRTSGQSTIIRLTSIGGNATVLNLQLRARSISVSRVIQTSESDPNSITVHGKKNYPNTIPLVTANDVEAVSETILAHYSTRRPIIRMRIVACDPAHLVQIFSRTLSDRISVVNAELGMSSDFFIERLDFVVSKINPNTASMHAAVFGCERELQRPPNNPFTFDKVGAGFNDGVFDPIAANNPANIWIWNSQNRFDVNKLAT